MSYKPERITPSKLRWNLKPSFLKRKIPSEPNLHFLDFMLVFREFTLSFNMNNTWFCLKNNHPIFGCHFHQKKMYTMIFLHGLRMVHLVELDDQFGGTRVQKQNQSTGLISFYAGAFQNLWPKKICCFSAIEWISIYRTLWEHPNFDGHPTLKISREYPMFIWVS